MRMEPASGMCSSVVLKIFASFVVILGSFVARGIRVWIAAAAGQMAIVMYVVFLTDPVARGILAMKGVSVGQIIFATHVVWMVNLAVKGIRVGWILPFAVRMDYAIVVVGMISLAVKATRARKVTSVARIRSATNAEVTKIFAVKRMCVMSG